MALILELALPACVWSAVCSAAAVEGYPTMKIVGKDFVAKEYSGGRTVDAFNHYVTSRTNELNVKVCSTGLAVCVAPDEPAGY